MQASLPNETLNVTTKIPPRRHAPSLYLFHAYVTTFGSTEGEQTSTVPKTKLNRSEVPRRESERDERTDRTRGAESESGTKVKDAADGETRRHFVLRFPTRRRLNVADSVKAVPETRRKTGNNIRSRHDKRQERSRKRKLCSRVKLIYPGATRLRSLRLR